MPSKTPGMNFDVIEKLKSMNSHWSIAKEAQPYQDGSNYELSTIMTDGVEYAMYKRQGEYFVLVDFFNKYDDACDEAKDIIDSRPDIKSIFK